MEGKRVGMGGGGKGTLASIESLAAGSGGAAPQKL